MTSKENIKIWRRQWLKNQPVIKHVRRVSVAIDGNIPNKQDHGIAKAKWLASHVNNLQELMIKTSERSVRILVAKALKDYRPGKTKVTEFQMVPPEVWARFRFQARTLVDTQAQLLAYFILAEGER